MRTLYRSLLVPTLCVAVSVLMFADVSHAKKGGNSGSKVKVDVRAELEPCGAVALATSPCDPAGTPPEPDAKGKMRHQKEIRKGVLKKDEFKGNVKMRVHPASALGIVDEASAENADIRLILSRNSTDFAECFLQFDEFDDDEEDEDEAIQAVFKIHVRMKKGAVKVTKGVCDVDLGTASIQSGVPDAQDGDLATATLVRNPVDRTQDIDFLQDIFEQH